MPSLRGNLDGKALHEFRQLGGDSKKRSAKSLIDVGADRAGDAVSGGLMQACL